MSNTANLVERYADKASNLKHEYLLKVQAFIQAEASGADCANEFRQAHVAALAYFNFYEEISGHTEVLSTSATWRADLADDCVEVLGSILRHQNEFIQPTAVRLGLDGAFFRPGPRAYRKLQRLVAQQLPTEVAALRTRFQASGLGTGGFDLGETETSDKSEESGRNGSAPFGLIMNGGGRQGPRLRGRTSRTS